jgi:peroxiredoxin (alkyl hydroperoxide reductase subunit C)
MNAAVRDSLVTGYEPLIDGLTLPDQDDRHVLAAAVRSGAQVIITSNLKDFPGDVLKSFGIEPQSPDEFVLQRLGFCGNLPGRGRSPRHQPRSLVELEPVEVRVQPLVEDVARSADYGHQHRIRLLFSASNRHLLDLPSLDRAVDPSGRLLQRADSVAPSRPQAKLRTVLNSERSHKQQRREGGAAAVPEMLVAQPRQPRSFIMSDTPHRPTSLPRLNEPAPDFKVRTTHGDRSLADYQGKWLVLFSHPADFTPVCTTEFIGFSRAADRFKAMNTELLGLSIDSLFSHLAWTRNIKEKFDVNVPFPIIEDIKMEVASAYGMVHPGAADTQAVRATFFIDPKGILRAMVYYPMSNGRSINEFLRLLEAMQTSDLHGVATPEGWKAGEDVIVPPPKTAADADARAGKGYQTVDWYFSKKKL